jgi:hypothetical protein
VGLVNKLQQICTQLGDTAGNSILVDKLSSIVVIGGQVRGNQAVPALHAVPSRPRGHNLQQLGLKQGLVHGFCRVPANPRCWRQWWAVTSCPVVPASSQSVPWC